MQLWQAPEASQKGDLGAFLFYSSNYESLHSLPRRGRTSSVARR